MPRASTRAQALQNIAFLRALRRTGNVRAACREIGVHRATYIKRRAKDPAFAAEWDAALAVAHAALGDAGASATGEPRVLRRTNGRLQLRRAQAGRLTRAHEQSFLAALSATANVRLSAAAAGLSHSAFYHRRKTSQAFAREFQLALEMGWERLEMALLASIEPESAHDDAWRNNDPPPIPPMTADQALDLLKLHYRTTQLWGEAPYMKRRRGETTEQWSQRRAADYIAQVRRQDAEAAVAAAARTAYVERRDPHEHAPPWLPALHAVIGWSQGCKVRLDGMTAARTAAVDAAGMAERATAAREGGWRLRDTAGPDDAE